MRAGGAITLIAALFLGAIAAFMARSWLEGQAVANIAPTGPNTTIVVASQSLGFGAELNADNLREIPWSASSLPDGAFATKEELLQDGRRVVLGSLERNEPVLSWKVTGAGQRASLSALIEEGKKAVTVGVDVVRGVAGFVLPGERVDVLLTRTGRSQEGPMSEVLLQNVRVLAVDQLANEQTEEATVARAVTLEVDTEQAQKVILAAQVGSLSLILRQAGAAGREPSRRITAADLGESEFVGGPFVELDGEVEVETEAAGTEAADATPAYDPYAKIGVVRGVTRNEYSVIRE